MVYRLHQQNQILLLWIPSRAHFQAAKVRQITFSARIRLNHLGVVQILRKARITHRIKILSRLSKILSAIPLVLIHLVPDETRPFPIKHAELSECLQKCRQEQDYGSCSLRPQKLCSKLAKTKQRLYWESMGKIAVSVKILFWRISWARDHLSKFC